MRKLFAVILAVPVVILIVLWMLSSNSVLSVNPPVTAIGVTTPVKVHVSNPHGVRRITAFVEQGDARYQMAEETNPSSRIGFWRHHVLPRDYQFTVGKSKAAALHDGKARLIIEAQSNDLRGSTDRVILDVDVATQPPRLQVDEDQHYLNQGGGELVTFQPSGYWTEAGVHVGGYTFRSFPLPGKGKDQRFSLFAYPWDLAPDVVPRVFARNPTGTEATGRFWFKVFPKAFRSRELEINDDFLDRVVNQIDPGGTGELLDRFLKINGELRRKNNQTLADLRFKTEEKRLWHGAFLQLSNSKVESNFADLRTYIYKGKKVDQQVHLGFDLAVSKHTPVEAANDVRVLWASDLGIYGNCVVLDHGYALQSIYGHLSRIDVKVGDMVKKAQTLGLSGATGLAGGDHLHFSMQIDGVQVNPVEWFDAHWIHDRVLAKLEPGAAQ
ncbi:MAG TPA: M23 family metallopeptidase [Bryobacteraceae bacterium]|nr:M23 family metallopeptidase [Bryobacteraceae bacterium]